MSTTYLFLDRRFIAESDNVETVLAPHKMHDELCTIDGDTFWCVDHNHVSWYRDADGKFHGWRNRRLANEERHGDAWNCFKITSEDGIHWTTVDGPTKFNCVFRDEREPDPKRRYKCIYQGVAVFDEERNVKISLLEYERLTEAFHNGAKIEKGMFTAVSEDGINWTDHRNIVVDKYSDSANSWLPGADLGRNADLDGNKPEHRWWKPGEPGWSGGDNYPCMIWEPKSQKYVVFFRTNLDRRTWRHNKPQRRERATGRAEATVFGEWADHEMVLRADTTWQAKMGNGKFDYYQLQVWPCGNIWLGVISVFHWGEDRIRLELAWSPDTVNWERVAPGEEIVPITAERGSPDFGGHYACMAPQQVGDEIWMYLGASDGLHNKDKSGNATMMLAKFQPERFAGVANKKSSPAMVRTKVFTLADELSLNVNAADGSATVKLLDSEGNTITTAKPITSDDLAAKPEWEDASAVAGQIGKEVALEITLESATVFAVTS